MSLERIIKNLDVSKIKAPSGLTFGQELVDAANLLRECIQKQIDVKTMGKCISVSDIADLSVNSDSLLITIEINPDLRPSIFSGTNGKVANIFWLLNDGFVVQKDWYFDGFAHKERWVYRKAEHFVEQGIEDFNKKTVLPIKVKLIKRPDKYYWEE